MSWENEHWSSPNGCHPDCPVCASEDDKTTTPKVEMVCYSCGSDEVVADAYAEWSVERQEWVLIDTFDKGSYCNACDDETRIVEREITVKSICISQAVAANLEDS